MTRKSEIINSIMAMLKPKGPKLCEYFVESREHPGKWNRQGEILTKEQCLKMPARKHYFIRIVRAERSPNSYV